MTQPYRFPDAYKHGDIEPIFDDIFMVMGSFKMRRPLPIAFSRNMTIVRQGSELTLINTVRLTEEGLAELEALGEVKHIIRLAAFHGSDDPFYKQRYGAKLWSVDAPYTKSFKVPVAEEDVYFKPDEIISAETVLPITNARALIINSATPCEGLLLLPHQGGVLVSGDCFQNWAQTDRYFSLLGKIVMKKMGFIRPYSIGPGWLKIAKPKLEEIQQYLDLDFRHLIPAHGQVIFNHAREQYKQSIEKLSQRINTPT